MEPLVVANELGKSSHPKLWMRYYDYINIYINNKLFKSFEIRCYKG